MARLHFEKAIAAYGLKQYTNEELAQMMGSLIQKINSGINRNDPSTRGQDGGLAAFDTLTDPVTLEQWEQVPEGAQAIGCAFAGTNWITGLVTKKGGKPVFEEVYRKKIPLNQRQVTFAQLICQMADQIETAYKNTSTNTVAIAFGFAHNNLTSQNTADIDAAILSGTLSKSWVITDFDPKKPDQYHLGSALKDELKKRDIVINTIVIQNDTNAVAHYTDSTTNPQKTKLPAGFVFGTGDNAAFKKYNLEAGCAIVSEPDQIFQQMQQMGLIPSGEPNNIMEYSMGGDYIKFRAIAALALSHRNRVIKNLFTPLIIKKIINSDDGALISKIASGQLDRKALSRVLGFGSICLITEPMYAAIKKAAELALVQAGQLMGLMIAAIAKVAEVTTPSFYNVEGSVYWYGHRVKETADATIKSLLPDMDLTANGPVDAMGLIGVAQLAMIRALPKS